jgi:hypothetical protein
MRKHVRKRVVVGAVAVIGCAAVGAAFLARGVGPLRPVTAAHKSAPADPGEPVDLKPQCAQFAIHLACLKSGVSISLDEVCELLPPKPEGESMLEIARTLKKIGFVTRGLSLGWDELRKHKLPVVAHMKDHFVLVESFEDTEQGTLVGLLDALGVRRAVPREDFVASWDGAVLALESKDGKPHVVPEHLPPPKPGEPRIQFSTLFIDAGKVEWDQATVRYNFPFKNDGSGPLVIKNVKTSCDCTVVNHPKEPIAPGGEGVITIDYDINKRLGSLGQAAAVQTNDPLYPVVPVNVAAYVLQTLSVSPMEIVMPRASEGDVVAGHSFIRYFSRTPLKLGKIETDVPGLEGRAERLNAQVLAKVQSEIPAKAWKDDAYDNSYVVSLQYRPPPGQVGEKVGKVRIPTSLPGGRVIELTVKADTKPVIAATPRSLILGLLSAGEKVDKTIRLTQASGRPLHVLSVDAGDSGLECRYSPEPARAVPIRLTGIPRPEADLKTARILASVQVHGEAGPRTVTIPIVGRLAPGDGARASR